MGNNITDRLKYRGSIVKFSRKYGVAKALYKKEQYIDGEIRKK